MLAKRLYATLIPGSRQQMRFWFMASLLVAVAYGWVAFQETQLSPYMVHDDARQHLFWMRRFLNPQLFPNDLIADYFQSVAPWGFQGFYRAFALLGIDPLDLAKGVPLGVGLGCTVYGFGVCLQILPMPFAGFLTALLLNQMLWSHDDLASATPRAFMPLIFLAFLYYLLQRRLWPCLTAIVLEGLFYPQYVLVFAGILVLRPWRRGLRLTNDRVERRFCLAGLLTAVLVLLPYMLWPSPYGPVITGAEARLLPDFASSGNSRFFLADPWLFWLSGSRSGLLPTLKPPLIGLGVLLPLLLKLPRRFAMARYLTPNLVILGQIALVAVGLFLLAHALLFRLHLPSRYTAYTLRLVLVLATALCLLLLVEAGLRWLQELPVPFSRQLLVWGSLLCCASLLLLYPLYAEQFPATGYLKGRAPALYAYLAQQPVDTMVASLLPEANNIPSFAQRSVLVAPEYALPYHQGYAQQFRQRVQDQIQAQYSPDRAAVGQFIQRYGISFWLISPDWLGEDAAQQLKSQWVRQYPTAVATATANLQRGKPWVQQRSDACTVLQGRGWRLLKADCLL
ncbi:MAG: hypothetical protein ACKO7W_03170 [Elainella sp.]